MAAKLQQRMRSESSIIGAGKSGSWVNRVVACARVHPSNRVMSAVIRAVSPRPRTGRDMACSVGWGATAGPVDQA